MTNTFDPQTSSSDRMQVSITNKPKCLAELTIDDAELKGYVVSDDDIAIMSEIAKPYLPFGGMNPALRLTRAIHRISEMRAGLRFLTPPAVTSTQMTSQVEEADTSVQESVIGRLMKQFKR